MDVLYIQTEICTEIYESELPVYKQFVSALLNKSRATLLEHIPQEQHGNMYCYVSVVPRSIDTTSIIHYIRKY